MKINQKGFVKDIAIVILGVVILVGGYFVFFKKTANAPAENGMGIIEGALSYPSDFIPPMKICAEDINTKKQYCTTDNIIDSKYKYGEGYKISAPVGKYYVFATREGEGLDDYRAYYSQSNCGEKNLHDPIMVEVKQSVTISGIDACDWYK